MNTENNEEPKRDPQQWIKDGLRTIRAQKLYRGEVELEQSDLERMFPELLGPGKVMCDAWWPSGWTVLVYLLLEKIQRHNTLGDRESGSPIRIDQIKEKFGGLRFYWGGGYKQKIQDEVFKHESWPPIEFISAQISFAEEYTEYICQVDGRITDIMVTPGWIGYYARENLRKDHKSKLENGDKMAPQRQGFALGFTDPRDSDKDLEEFREYLIERKRKYDEWVKEREEKAKAESS